MSVSRRLADSETPVSLFLATREGFSHAVLLESVEGGERWARKSLIALGARNSLVVRDAADVGKVLSHFDLPEQSSSPLDYAFGHFAYEAAAAFIPLAGAPRRPDGVLCEFFQAQAVLLYDHRQHVLELHCVDDATAALLHARLDAPRAPQPISIESEPRTATRQTSASAYEAAVAKAKDYIAAGDAFQVVVAQRFTVDDPSVDLFSAYRRLRQHNPSPYLFYVKTPHLEASGASPETLVRVEDDSVCVRPIAGTRGRGKTPEHDLGLERELLADPKERAEHLMLVDLGRNDVGKVSAPGSVRVEPMMVVERYSHVMHIVSEVRGTLRPELTALDAFASAFPAGTLSGAPKKRAMEIIGELERAPRGLYGGAVGYFSGRRSCDFAIAIRTLFREGQALVVQAGAGVVYDSVAREEDAECLRKAASPLRSVGVTL